MLNPVKRALRENGGFFSIEIFSIASPLDWTGLGWARLDWVRDAKASLDLAGIGWAKIE